MAKDIPSVLKTALTEAGNIGDGIVLIFRP
jgi:hypothetical protein